MDLQTSDRWQQTFLHDKHGNGMRWANRRLAEYAPRAVGKYIWILDDDDLCTYDGLVADVERLTKASKPAIIMLKANVHGHGIIPEPEYWRKTPAHSHVAMSCFIVTRDLYQEHAAAFDIERAADCNFILAAFRSVDTDAIYWHPVVAMATQQRGWGKPE